MPSIFSGEPSVRLIAWTAAPYDIAMASARTCYSPGVVLPGEITPGQRERIGPGIWEAGHHTPFQHATFTFAIENVSRQFVWSFLHSHPYYNSDQTSQRYNLMGEPRLYAPKLDENRRRLYEEAALAAWDAYGKLAKLAQKENFRLMQGLGKIKGQNEKQVMKEAENKAIENARYVLPVAAFTSLYHTVSGLVLKRYQMMASQCDCPSEAETVVAKMIAEVEKIDPNFKMPVKRMKVKFSGNVDGDSFAKKFDSGLDGMRSKLVSYDKGAEEVVADAVREAVGIDLDDSDAIDLAVNPAKNPLLLETLNAWQNSPVTRALNHANYSFRKRISHACDSQDQRHRTTPASRPLLSRLHTSRPDVVEPEIIAKNSEMHKIFTDTCKLLWKAKNELIGVGVSPEDVIYLLPNAVALRFTETGRLIDLMHKWRMRTCFNAQEEIYNISMEELAQVSSKHPRLTRYMGPPCFFRRGLVEGKGKEGPCPEGPRWCGIDVWRNFPNVKRPF